MWWKCDDDEKVLELDSGDGYTTLWLPFSKNFFKKGTFGIPGWRSGLAPAFGPGRDSGDPGSNPTPGMEPASPSAYVSASVSLSVTIINK